MLQWRDPGQAGCTRVGVDPDHCSAGADDVCSACAGTVERRKQGTAMALSSGLHTASAAALQGESQAAGHTFKRTHCSYGPEMLSLCEQACRLCSKQTDLDT